MEDLRNRDSVDRRYTELVSAQVARGRRPSDAADETRDQVAREFDALHSGAECPAYIRHLGELDRQGEFT